MEKLHILDHPLIQHKLAVLRDKNTSVKDFREVVSEISTLMCYDATRDLPMEDIVVETPIAKADARRIAGKKMAIVPILRAGLGMVDGIYRLIPAAKVGHIGIYRDPDSMEPVEYYCKMPRDI
ncbi:MAG: uracil phosphoribosyltransferase, partial [Oscillospiraceae bacterium]|nr:uracil phosphoribosyltransferase [Oscillospiraceae bacterium]